MCTRRNLETELTRAQHTVPTAIQEMLGLSRETTVSRLGFQYELRIVEGERSKATEGRNTLQTEPQDVRM